MRIVFNRQAALGARTGIGHYTAELLHALQAQAGTDAIGLLARTEGVVLDPVYSAKGMAGLIADARAGRVDGPVVFWHTGGGPSVFAAGWGERLLSNA